MPSQVTMLRRVGSIVFVMNTMNVAAYHRILNLENAVVPVRALSMKNIVACILELLTENLLSTSSSNSQQMKSVERDNRVRSSS